MKDDKFDNAAVDIGQIQQGAQSIKRIKLTFCIDKDAGHHLLESPLSEDQQVKELDDAYEITATVVDSAMLEWWLRGFGDSVSDVRRGRIRANLKPKN
jgi:hypothetical protein